MDDNTDIQTTQNTNFSADYTSVDNNHGTDMPAPPVAPIVDQTPLPEEPVSTVQQPQENQTDTATTPAPTGQDAPTLEAPVTDAETFEAPTPVSEPTPETPIQAEDLPAENSAPPVDIATSVADIESVDAELGAVDEDPVAMDDTFGSLNTGE